MDITKITNDLAGCSCGRDHKCDTEIVEIGSGLVHKVGEILTKANFPKNILVVADCNTVKVSEGVCGHGYGAFRKSGTRQDALRPLSLCRNDELAGAAQDAP